MEYTSINKEMLKDHNMYSPPSINVTLKNVNSFYFLTISYSPYIAN